jgi:hypothetical protein
MEKTVMCGSFKYLVGELAKVESAYSTEHTAMTATNLECTPQNTGTAADLIKIASDN